MIASVIHTLSEQLPEGSEPPKEIRLFRAGLNQTTKGEFLFDDVAAGAIMEAYAQCPTHPDLMMDYGHDSLKPSGPVERHEAAGWFKLEMRNGELWATDIRWVDEVADKIRAKKYRFYSPAFTPSANEPLRPVRVVNCAITNLPATIGLQPLVAASEFDNSMMQKICEMLGLDPATCTEQDVMTALATMQKEMAEMKAKMEAPASAKEPTPMADPLKCSEVDEVIALSGVEDKADWKGAIVVLSNEVKTLRAEKQTAKVAGIVEDAIKARKLAPSQRASMTKLGMRDLEMLSEVIESAAPILPEPSIQPEKQELVTLSDEELQIVKRTGVSVEAYLATRQTLDAQNQG